MEKAIRIHSDAHQPLLEQMQQKARSLRGSNFSAADLHEVQTELRNRRKAFLGSSAPLTSVVCKDGRRNKVMVDTFVDYLVKRTIAFWSNEDITAEMFCRKFYDLSILAIVTSGIGEESLDDIIRLATLLTHRPRDIYEAVMKALLPSRYCPLLFSFTEDFPESFYSASFEDAVFAALMAFLGVIPDPLSEEEGV